MSVQLLELSDRVRSEYHALAGSLALVREWVALTGVALEPEWLEALDRRGALSAWLLSIDDPETWTGDRSLEALLAAAPFPRLHAAGYWYSEHEPELPMPITPSGLDRRTRDAVAARLRGGDVWMTWMGYSSCRVCRRDGAELGSCDLTDGVWVWPEGLAHYVESHDIALPRPFVDHLVSGASRSRRERQILATLHDTHLGIDFGHWLAWATQAGASSARRAPRERGWMVRSYETRGPFTDEQVRSMIAAGTIEPYHRLWRLGIGPERKARDMPGFAALFASHKPKRL